MQFTNWFKKHFYTVILFLITLVLCLKNFTPGTFLIGWDNLMPELNIGMNLKRSFFAVWQTYQGLGLVGGMAHSTDLIRQLIIFPLTLFLPLNLIRYLWHFAMIFLGTFGIFFGLTKVLKFKESTSFVASLFYLLSFGSVQNFWAPLETFSTFWGFFPWLIFSLLHYLNHPSKSKLKKLLLINFLAIPAFYVQTVFIVYCLTLFIIFIFHPKSFFTLLKILLINFFWLLPLTYFTITNISNPVTGIGNFMSNEETFLRNFSRGFISDFLLLRGYYFDFPKNGVFLMDQWQTFFKSPIILTLGYILGSIPILGLITLIFKKSKKLFEKVITGFFLLICLALLSHTPPFEQINQLIRQFPLIDQIFRSPFTKFITPAVFTFSVLIAIFLEKLNDKIQKISYLIISLFIVIFSFPSFLGFYISPDMRQNIPQSYFQLFDFFKSQNPNSRIANLPQGSFWGWTNYRWGVTGSGFLWYGIEQPILDRAFDAWNIKNEQYYWELNTALQKQDPVSLNQIFQKYSIEFIIFDNNVYFPDDKIYGNTSVNTQEMLNNMPNLKKVAQFDQITVYQTNFSNQKYLINNPQSIKSFDFYYTDPAFSKYNHYINTSKPNIEFPFVNLFTNRLPQDQPFKIKTDKTSITITTNSDKSTTFTKDNSVNSQFYVSLPGADSQLTVYNFPKAQLNQDYLVEVNYHYISGLPFEITAVSSNARHKYFDTKLEKSVTDTTGWFIIPAHQTDDFQRGINLILNNPKINSLISSNQINSIKIYPFNLSNLINQEIINNDLTETNYFFYSQSYSSGWIAYYFDGFKPVFLKNHVLANNWANAWEIPKNINSSQINIIFWPQIFEFIGLTLSIYIFIWIIKSKKSNSDIIN
ncbi:MAG: hypothetical protein WCX33_00695 [Candidatus Shapirobacteria bacterium]